MSLAFLPKGNFSYWRKLPSKGGGVLHRELSYPVSLAGLQIQQWFLLSIVNHRGQTKIWKKNEKGDCLIEYLTRELTF